MNDWIEDNEVEHDPELAKRIEDSDIFNLGVYASEDGNHDEAIHHYNRCLERTPEPTLAFLALHNLGIAIEQKYRFWEKGGGENASDAEVLWSIRRGICGEQAMKIYDEVIDHSAETMEGLDELYTQAKFMLNGGITWGVTKMDTNGELSWRDFHGVRYADVLPLSCIADEEKEYWANTSVK